MRACVCVSACACKSVCQCVHLSAPCLPVSPLFPLPPASCLQGVLSYYEVDGPDSVSVLAEVQRRPHARLLGDEIRHCLMREHEEGEMAGAAGIGIGVGAAAVGLVGDIAERPHGEIRLEVSLPVGMGRGSWKRGFLL